MLRRRAPAAELAKSGFSSGGAAQALYEQFRVHSRFLRRNDAVTFTPPPTASCEIAHVAASSNTPSPRFVRRERYALARRSRQRGDGLRRDIVVVERPHPQPLDERGLALRLKHSRKRMPSGEVAFSCPAGRRGQHLSLRGNPSARKRSPPTESGRQIDMSACGLKPSVRSGVSARRKMRCTTRRGPDGLCTRPCRSFQIEPELIHRTSPPWAAGPARRRRAGCAAVRAQLAVGAAPFTQEQSSRPCPRGTRAGLVLGPLEWRKSPGQAALVEGAIQRLK